MRKYIFIGLLTILISCFTFFRIASNPPSLNWDEVSHGYNAYSILKTGKDEWGFSFPLLFRAFGDYKLPLYIYLSTISVALFGLTTFSVRFISILAGILAIPGMYLLSSALFPNKKVKLTSQLEVDFNLLSALVIAALPWHIFLSRPALEANLFLCLFIYGWYFLTRSLKKYQYFPIAGIFMALTLQAYNSARVITPLFLFFYFLIHKSKIKINKFTLSAFVIFLLSLLVVIIQALGGSGLERYKKLQILNENTVHIIGQNRQNSKLPQPLPKLIYNRPVYLISKVAENYFSYFTPQFFTQSSGAQSQFAIPGENLLNIVGMVLFYLGIILVFKNITHDPRFLEIATVLLLAPLPASFTSDPPQAIRPILMILPATLLVSLTLKTISQIHYSLFLVTTSLFLVFSLIYCQKYFSDYPKKYSASWQYGYQQVFEFIKDHQGEYKNIFITKRYGEPHIFYAFFNQLDPKILQDKTQTIRFHQSDWYWTDKIQNVYFVNDWQIPTTSIKTLKLESGGVINASNSLLITSYDHQPINSHLISEINFLDGKPAFKIVSIP